MRSSPRRALARAASSMRARSTPSSNSLMLPFMPEQQAVVRPTGIVDAIEVDHTGLHQATELQQVMPVAAVAGQAGCIKAQHRADLACTQPRDQTLKARPRHHATRRAAEIVVDHRRFGPRRRATSTSSYCAAGSRGWSRPGPGWIDGHRRPPCGRAPRGKRRITLVIVALRRRAPPPPSTAAPASTAAAARPAVMPRSLAESSAGSAGAGPLPIPAPLSAGLTSSSSRDGDRPEELRLKPCAISRS